MDFLIHLNNESSRPLRDQIYDGLRHAILDGELSTGARLPSSRVLATNLGVSRFTVTDAYNRLLSEGYVAGRHGSGTFVAPSVAAAPIDQHPPLETQLLPAPARAWSSWSDRAQSIGEISGPAPQQEIDFRHALPDLSHFPHAVWRRLLVREGKQVDLASRYYGHPAGWEELRGALAGYLNRSRSIPCSPEQIVITSGCQEAVDLMARVWLDQGDAVAVEEPGYPRSRRTFATAGAEIKRVPVDHDGLRVDLLDERAANAKLIYVTPSHHYPTGAVLPLNRRLALLEWARERGALILEDDYNSEFRYGSRPIPAMAGLDATGSEPGSVIYIGTMSKVLYPSLRLGYLVVPSDMIDRVLMGKEVSNRNAPHLEQATLAAFITEGHFERHLNRVRKLYAERRRFLITALDEELGAVARFDRSISAAGLHLLVGFDLPYSANEIAAKAASVGVHLDSAQGCYEQSPELPSFMIGYASLDEAAMRDGLQRLRRAFAI